MLGQCLTRNGAVLRGFAQVIGGEDRLARHQSPL
jgi:hypothetical protein